MRGTILIWILLAVTTEEVFGQGIFIWSNGTAPTRLYTIDGPLAGPGIWGQMLAGPAPDDLVPLAVAMEHVAGGWIGSPGHVAVRVSP